MIYDLLPACSVPKTQVRLDNGGKKKEQDDEISGLHGNWGAHFRKFFLFPVEMYEPDLWEESAMCKQHVQLKGMEYFIKEDHHLLIPVPRKVSA